MPHHLVEIREPPPEVVALRTELQQPWNLGLCQEAMKGENFQECLGILALQLGIELKGFYEIPQLCGLLLAELRKKRLTFH
jgi:hypothetical protein